MKTLFSDKLPLCERQKIESSSLDFNLELDRLLTTIAASIDQAKTPLVIFDLDDTLFYSRSRTHFILQEFVALPNIQLTHPLYVKKIETLSWQAVKYHLGDTLVDLDITEAKFVRELKAVWNKAFFSDACLGIDKLIEGGPTFVNKLFTAGADLVYLTGRGSKNMRNGTESSLKKNGFPFSDRTHLLMKPSNQLSDIEYKISAFKNIAELGSVIAGFDNEPQIANAIKSKFKTAEVFLLDTAHAGRNTDVSASVKLIKNYL